MSEQPLGRRVPTDWQHVDRWPLTAAAIPTANVPVVIGVNWYQDFDRPVWQGPAVGGHWWIGLDYRNLGRIRGGHCVCLKPKGVGEPIDWWSFYDQGSEGACVGFGCSRAMSLLNRRRYFARWLWDRAKERDEWGDTNPGDGNGTSVRAGFDVLRLAGHVPWKPSLDAMNTDGESEDWRPRAGLTPTYGEGIAANRWARSADDAAEALGYQGLGYVDILNSWGRSYPHLVRMPLETLERLLFEDGEIGIVTDR